MVLPICEEMEPSACCPRLHLEGVMRSDRGLLSQPQFCFVFLSTYYVSGAELGALRMESHIFWLEVRRPGLNHFLGCKGLDKALTSLSLSFLTCKIGERASNLISLY